MLGTSYIPPTQSRFFNEEEIDRLEGEIMSMCSRNKYVCITGELNAQIGHSKDYVEMDEYLSDTFNFDEETTDFFDKSEILVKSGIPLKQVSKDNKINTSGNWLLDICKYNNLFVANWRVGKDKDIGDKTFQNTSTLDYTLCTAEVFNLLSTFEVTELDPLFSDGHCMLNWSLNTIIRTTTQPQGNANHSHSPPIWSEKQKEYFVKSINL